MPDFGGGPDDEVDGFTREVTALSGVARRLRPANLDSLLERLVREHEIRRACLWATPLLARMEVAGRLIRLGVTIVPPGADLHQVLTEASNAPYLVLVTGPSLTADIELTVTLGVHGPQQLHVWVV